MVRYAEQNAAMAEHKVPVTEYEAPMTDRTMALTNPETGQHSVFA